MAACDPGGRPLYAAHADLDWPVEPHLALWFGLTLLREFRGDGHIAATLVGRADRARGPGHPHRHRHRLHRAGRQGDPGLERGRSGRAAVAGLAARGLMTPDGGLTEQGTALRAAIESATDERAAAPWDALGEVGASRLAEIGRPLARRGGRERRLPGRRLRPRR